MADGLVQVGVELLADGLNGLQAFLFEGVAQLLLSQADAFHPALDLELLRHGGQRSLEVVQHRQQRLDQALVEQLAHLGALLLGTPLEVAEIGRGPPPLFQVVVGLGPLRLQLRLQILRSSLVLAHSSSWLRRGAPPGLAILRSTQSPPHPPPSATSTILLSLSLQSV